MASEPFEIVVGGDEGGLVDRREGGGKAVYVRDMVERSQFGGLQSLCGINRHDVDGKEREIIESFSRGFFATPRPGKIEDLAPIDDRSHEGNVQAIGFSD